MTARTLGLAVALLLAAGAAHAQDDDASSSIDDRPHITVLGSAMATGAPDTAEIRLGVALDKPTAAEAWNATRDVAAALVDAAKADGVPPEDIATASVDLAQRFDSIRQPDGSMRNEARGFHASYAMVVRLHDFARIGTLTQALIGKGANTFEGISFAMARTGALEDRLWGDAMHDAHRKAQALAAAAGVKLGALLQVERPDQQPAAPRPLMRSAVAAPAMPFAPGTQTLSAEVEATYAIE